MQVSEGFEQMDVDHTTASLLCLLLLTVFKPRWVNTLKHICVCCLSPSRNKPVGGLLALWVHRVCKQACFASYKEVVEVENDFR